MSLLDQDLLNKNMVPLHDVGVRIWGVTGLHEIMANDLTSIRDIINYRIGLKSSWVTLYNIFKEVIEKRSGIEFIGMDISTITPRLFPNVRKTTIMPAGLYIKCFTTGFCPVLIVYGCNDWDRDCGDLPVHYRGELLMSPNSLNIEQTTVEDLAGLINIPHYFDEGTWHHLYMDLYINQRLV